MAKRLSNRFFVMVYIAIFFVGCTINYNEGSDIAEKSTDIPDSVMENFSMTQIKQNEPYTEIYASKTEIYDDQNKILLYNVSFKKYNNYKEVETQGSADYVEYFNNTEDAKLTGNLKFVSKKDELEMSGEYLYWKEETKTISSKKDTPIIVIMDDGSRIEGYGFSADIKNSTFSFQDKVSGVAK